MGNVVEGRFGYYGNDQVVGVVDGPVLKRCGVCLYQCGVKDIDWEVVGAFRGVKLKSVEGLCVVR